MFLVLRRGSHTRAAIRQFSKYPVGANCRQLAKFLGIFQPLALPFKTLFELPPAYFGDLTVNH